MAKKQKTTSATPATPPKNTLLSAIATGGGIAAVTVLACFVFLNLWQLPQQQQREVQLSSQQLAQSQAQLLTATLKGWQQQLAGIAESDAVLQALEHNDRQRIAALEQDYSAAFPHAVSLRLIHLGQLGIASLRKNDVSMRNNIEVDLLRAVSGGGTAVPEAYRYEGRWLVSLAQAAKRDDKLYAAGAVLLSVDAAFFVELLERASSPGASELVQNLGRDSQVLARAGNGAAAPAVSVPLLARVMKDLSPADAERWQLRFTPSAVLVEQYAPQAALLWGLLALCLLALGAGCFYILSQLRGALRDDLEKLSATDAASFALPGFEAVHQQWRQRLKQLKANALAAEKAAAKAAQPAPAAPTDNPAPAHPGAPTAAADSADTPQLPTDLPAAVFRAYDIRGNADQQLTDAFAYAVGLAFGSEALDQGQQEVIVGADGRNSSARIHDALVKGLLASGRDVLDIGMVPTPMLYFATHQLGTETGIMVTGSHNPPADNGFKMVIAGKTLSGDAVMQLKTRIETQNFASGQGNYRGESVDTRYIDYIVNDVAVAQPLKIVLDAGNGVTGAIAPQLFQELGCEVVSLYCDVDGNFPNHHPDPTVAANLNDLVSKVQEEEADIGIAFDGDGDRLGVVSRSGKIINADTLLMLLAQDVVSRNPGADVLFDVKCTRSLNSLISSYGGRPIMWKSGHSFMKEKMAETGALVGGEFSGHIFFNERWFGFDDGMYAAARLIEILSTTDPDLDVHLELFPEAVTTPEIKVEAGETQKFAIVERLAQQQGFGDGKVSLLDGVRVDFQDGWGLVRASNTSPALTLRFEADNDEALARIQALFKQQLNAAEPSLALAF